MSYPIEWGNLAETNVEVAFDLARGKISDLQKKLAQKSPLNMLLPLIKITGPDSMVSHSNYLTQLQFRLKRTFEPGEGNIYTALGYYAQLLEQEIEALG